MKHAGTYFEQVPKEIVEKIVAEQDSLAEKDFREDGATKAREGKVVSPRLVPRKI